MDASTKTRRPPTPKARAPAKLPDRRSRGRSELEALAVQAAAAARMLKLLGNEHRLLILCFLAAHGEMKVGDLVEAIGLSQSALSQHLALLREDRLVSFRRESQTLYYRVCDDRAARILKLLKDIYCGDLA
jgi:ArsR family transcriptional regulator, virulence genes transcriptional regulator